MAYNLKFLILKKMVKSLTGKELEGLLNLLQPLYERRRAWEAWERFSEAQRQEEFCN